jgi:hypothetical protein
MADTNRRAGEESTRDERVASLLAAAAAPTEPGPLPGESRALAAYRAAYQSPVTRRSRMLSSLTSVKTATAAVAGAGVLVTGGVAAAVTGSLPGAAQETAHDMLARVGVSVPGPDDSSAGHADERGSSDQAPAAQERDAGAGARDGGSGKGAEVSGLATDPTLRGVDKGAAVSGAASEGRSQAGERGSAEAPGEPAGGDGGQAQVDTPNTGGEDRPGSDGSDGADESEASGGSDAGVSAEQGSPVERPDVAGDVVGGGEGRSGPGNRP